jgi:hypothetical protein
VKHLDPRLYSVNQVRGAPGDLPGDRWSFCTGTAEPWQANGTDKRNLTDATAVKAERPEPESPRTARRWDGAKAAYLRDGLCHRCAAQAAWGHQLGFSRIRPPCADCRPIVDRFPVSEASPWRRFPVASQRPRNGPESLHTGNLEPATALEAPGAGSDVPRSSDSVLAELESASAA